ncbi:class I SAM-dependent methyltransferase [Tautonia sociabilis]|uniref:DUF1698 domain-containing protein n=1 Tax=Tautonia sociabilis TaxID=2080755 RepID=A0A432MFT9_9BACT|nr:methyltransferase domain-containing protein [Tautonia sociabilis]RUL85266.1 DUF1698 domain-containing protein [Tautonia sociabilis]
MESTAALPEQIRRIHWWYAMDLGDGIRTPGVVDAERRAEEVGLPADLTGKRVLDIGTWDGFMAFEAERRGASRVVAMDHVVWNDPVVGKAGFELARAAFGSTLVEDVDCDVYDLTPEAVGGTFDLVLFLGVLYHVQDPVYVLKRVAAVAENHLILETHVDLVECDRPAIAYYPGTECANDLSNWVGPNPPAVEAMLRTVGFSRVERGWSDIRSSPRRPWSYDVVGSGRSRYGRMVFHAWK